MYVCATAPAISAASAQAAAGCRHLTATRSFAPHWRRALSTAGEAVGGTASANTWLEYKDDTDGRPYYFNEATKETTWTRPEGDDVVIVDAETGMAGSSSNSGEAAAAVDGTRADADGKIVWEMYADPTDARVYYYNPVTHETEWEEPVGDNVKVVDCIDLESALPEPVMSQGQGRVARGLEQILHERRMEKLEIAKREAHLSSEDKQKELMYRVLGSGWEDRSNRKLDWRHYTGWTLFAGLLAYFTYLGLTGPKGPFGKPEAEVDVRRRRKEGSTW